MNVVRCIRLATAAVALTMATSPTLRAQYTVGVTRLDLNFVTTSEIIRDPSNLSLKPFDSLGEIPGTAGSYATFDVASTRSYRNADTVREPTGDADPGSSGITAAQLAQLDITDFSIEVRRGG